VADVALSNPSKVLFPESGVTKLEIAEYYEAAADVMLPFIARRPLTLVRCPSGIADCFYQKQIEAGVPDCVVRVPIPDGDGSVDYGAVDSVTGLVSLVQLGVLEFHTWGARVGDIERPDRFTIDLDPDPSVPWPRVLEAAVRVRNFLLDIGLGSFVKTTGGKGLHVVVPVEPERGWDEVKEFSRGISAGVAAAQPGRYTLNVSKASRRGRILIDYLRNGRGATAVEVWSTRARSNAPVSVPLYWEELAEGVRSDQFNVRNVADRISAVGARPWAEYATTRQSITTEMLKAVASG
jgi:bifunctional non-homologous end joining protein LigD